MLTSKQRKLLKSEAHHLQPIFQVGKSGLTSTVIEQIRDALEARELIKVSILQNCPEDKNDIVHKLEEADIHVVQTIGKVLVLYKESIENKRIELP